MEKLPPRTAGFLDFALRPDFRNELGGPFNGQMRRQELIQDLMNARSFCAVVETGTYRGSTAEFFLRWAKTPLYTVESVPRYYRYSQLRLRRHRDAHLFLGDSRAFLKQLQRDPAFPKRGVLFYLDAHWYKDLPLREEMRLVAEGWSESVVVIDDFEVPDDPGYSFDDYGEGKRLCIEYLRLSKDSSWEAFWPSAPSSAETGNRRGCVVLVTRGSVAGEIKSLRSLRQISNI